MEKVCSSRRPVGRGLMIWSSRLNLQPSHMEATTGCSSSCGILAAHARAATRSAPVPPGSLRKALEERHGEQELDPVLTELPLKSAS